MLNLPVQKGLQKLTCDRSRQPTGIAGHPSGEDTIEVLVMLDKGHSIAIVVSGTTSPSLSKATSSPPGVRAISLNSRIGLDSLTELMWT